jgi:isocitrate dehydrogenase
MVVRTHSITHDAVSILIPFSVTGKFACTLIPGDGIGAEITDSVKEIFESINVPIEWEQFDVSGETTGGEALFRQAMDSLKRNKVGLKGEFLAVFAFTPCWCKGREWREGKQAGKQDRQIGPSVEGLRRA